MLLLAFQYYKVRPVIEKINYHFRIYVHLMHNQDKN